MIGLFDANGNRLSLTIETIVFNNNSDPADDRYQIDTIRPATQIDYVSDPKQETDGLEVYRPRKIGRLLIVDGIIRATSIGRLFDKMDLLSGTLDPVTLYDKYPTTFGFVPIDFTTPSVSGNKACRYYVRTNRVIEPLVTAYQPRQEALFSIEFLMRDPRRYLQAQSTLAGGGTAVNAGNYKTWPTLTITMTGAGSASYQATNSTLGKTLTLNLGSRVNGDVVVVDMEQKKILLNGVETPSIQAGSFWNLAAGNNTIVYANTTNASSSLAWRSAFAA